MGVYIVQPGDTPSSIAKALTGSTARTAELVRQNPRKPSVFVGRFLTFQSLQAGEALNLPPTWPNRTTPMGDYVHPWRGVGQPTMRGSKPGEWGQSYAKQVYAMFPHPVHRGVGQVPSSPGASSTMPIVVGVFSVLAGVALAYAVHEYSGSRS